MITSKFQKGLSLIELMVTLIISSLLLLGVMQLFINTSSTDRTSNELARVQETGRLVVELIAREARRAGYQGCVGASVETKGTVKFTPNIEVDFPDDALIGTDTSLTFTYARPDPDGDFINRDCDNSQLEAYQVTFENCGVNLCMTDPLSGGRQQVAANTNFAAIRYLLPCGGGTCSRTAGEVTNMQDIKKLEVTLAVNDSRGEFAEPRRFTSLIELRNRL
jgi:prepilin-type N-terminal cleavage/methylation domain-containing protein